MSSLVRHTLKLIILCYRYTLSLILPGKCRYFPTCSAYALDALKDHTVSQALLLIGKRILRCHPWAKKDYYDPIPSKKRKNNGR